MAKNDELGITLELFNEMATKLLELSFSKYVLSQHLSYKVNLKGEKPKTEFRGPDIESQDAFILNFRFFIQNNERISLHNIGKIYDQLDVPIELKMEYNEKRGKLNEYLESNAPPQSDGHGLKSLTNRELMELILYGERAHINKEKRKQIKKFEEKRILWDIMKNIFFIKIMSEVLLMIRDTKELNKKVLDYIRV